MGRSVLSHDAQLVKLARGIARMERKRKDLRYQLRQVNKDLSAAKRSLKGYAQSIVDIPWNERAPKFGTLGDK